MLCPVVYSVTICSTSTVASLLINSDTLTWFIVGLVNTRLSNINSTQSIRDFTNTTFGKSSGLSSWLIQNIIEDIYKIDNHESRRGCLNVRELADHIKRINGKNIGEQLLEFTRGRESDDEITKTIQDTKGGELFIMKLEII